MTRLGLIALLLGSGCFYTDPINQRPSIDIHQRSSAAVHRGDQVLLDAVASDPEGQPVFFQWRAYLCTDAATAADGSRPGCDVAPFYTEIQPTAKFQVHALRDDVAVPVQAVFVTLEGKDDLGATARPIQELVIPVGNAAPALVLQQAARYGAVIGTPVDLFASVGDPDDGSAAVDLQWQVFSPATQPAYELVDETVPQDPAHPELLQVAKLLTPHGVGEWHVQLTGVDPLGASTTKEVAVVVVADHAPCLAQWAPVVAPAGDTLPVAEPTLFQVPVVADDLDPYPAVAGDPVLGTPDFSWSIRVNGGTRQLLDGSTSNHAVLDPAAYTAGDQLELRVEIDDRNHTPITCADGDATCSVISDNACLQRLTWAVEIR